MKKVNVEICMGTACFVMGSSNLMDIQNKIPSQWKELVEIKSSLCCDLCRNWKDSKPPIVKINDEIISKADENKILSNIEDILSGGNDVKSQ